MIGYWDAACPVKSGQKDVLATVYQRRDATLVAVASWARDPVSVQLDIDWQALGLKADECAVTAPEVAGFQSAAEFGIGESVPIEPGRGLLLVMEKRK
jgi:hypothetical protein